VLTVVAFAVEAVVQGTEDIVVVVAAVEGGPKYGGTDNNLGMDTLGRHEEVEEVVAVMLKER